MEDTRAAVRTLGWLSIALGATSVLAPGLLGWLAGQRPRRLVPRVLGARDLVIGTGLLAAADARPWLRARLAAEMMDTGLHATAGLVGLFGRKRAFLAALTSVTAGAVERRLLQA